MELVDGGNLHDLIKNYKMNGKKFSSEQVLRWFT